MAASRTSARGRLFIAREEGTVLRYYHDPVGFCTVGIGHLVRRGPCTAAELRTRISAARALAILAGDLRRFEAAVRKIGVPLNQNRFDALVSLAVNCGEGSVGPSSTVYRLIRAGDYDGAADAFLLWRNAGGKPILLARRQRERALFRTPVKPAAPDPFAGYPADERRWLHEYDDLQRRGVNVARRHVLRRTMTERRQEIWRAAQPRAAGGDGKGWGYRRRAARFKSLRARTG